MRYHIDFDQVMFKSLLFSLHGLKSTCPIFHFPLDNFIVLLCLTHEFVSVFSLNFLAIHIVIYSCYTFNKLEGTIECKIILH